LPIVAAFVQDQCKIRVAIRSVFSASPRAKQYCPLQLYVGGNPREEITYCTLGIWIKKFHKRHFGRKAGGGQFLAKLVSDGRETGSYDFPSDETYIFSMTCTIWRTASASTTLPAEIGYLV
jgi:hypothetical protein